ncbi:histidine phosphatase family protein [Natronincola ferrireducens]|uniref:Probable phosphoglycerate mutase n=1 Tax=Natronincola ferrireducens TaxID=393762 RepID=A0A1G9CAN6_9FIRM|nr:histidine phosphatase family protein [Natronincola ferrireducens]SDK48484.1 probable phosphoglycerate mutase [Natronincola ferrireducens]
MKKLYVVRHGETNWNLEGRTQGIKDSQLTDDGLLQAQLLAKRLIEEKIEVIYSSCLLRAKSTAEIISKILKLPYYCDKNLNEMNFGQWEGLTNEQILKLYPSELKTWRNYPHETCIPSGEKLISVQRRIVEFVENVLKNTKEKNILIISHSTIIKLLLLNVLNMDICNYYRLKQENCCINIIEFRNYGPVLLKYNETGHIQHNSR